MSDVPDSAPPAPVPAAARPKRSLTQRTASGFVWMMLQTVLTQVITFGGQIALGWILFKDQFGLYALANAVGVGAAAAHKVGLRPILVKRYRSFHLWANPAFWFSLTLGLGSTLLLVIAAPFADALFKTDANSEGLWGLILILAVTMPFTAIAVVPEARIQAEMRFRLLAVVRFWMVAGTMGITVILALFGLGVYSFVLARVVVSVSRALGLLWVAPIPLRRSPQFRRWRYMVRDGVHLSVTNVCNYVTTNFDYFILGFFHPEAIVGLYFYAYGLSQRAFVMLTRNLRDVLFPSLASLASNPVRQTQAYLRATRLLMVIGMPACLLQIALARPAFSAVLKPEWADGAIVLEILSLGTAFRLAGQPAFSLIQAQGRFGLVARLSIAVTLFFLVVVIAGARLGAEQAVAVAVAAFMVITGPLQIWLGIRRDGGTVGDVVGIFARPLIAGTLAIGGAWWVAWITPPVLRHDWQMLILIPPLGMAAYAVLARWMMPKDFADLRERITAIVRRRRPAAVATVAPPPSPPPPSPPPAET